jgi:hypothetical protein
MLPQALRVCQADLRHPALPEAAKNLSFQHKSQGHADTPLGKQAGFQIIQVFTVSQAIPARKKD